MECDYDTDNITGYDLSSDITWELVMEQSGRGEGDNYDQSESVDMLYLIMVKAEGKA